MVEKTYDEFINEILNVRGRFACDEEYHERHHIIPKCMGGTNDEDNLIDLFAREHYEAHRLLALENPENDKLVYAWWAMVHLKDENQKRIIVSAEEYEEAKIAYAEVCSRRNSGEHNPMYGISPRERMDDETYNSWIQKVIEFNQSEESRKNRRYKNLGKKYSDDVNKKKGRSGEYHHMYGKHHTEEAKKKISDANKGKVMSEESRQKISNAIKGERNPFYGKSHSEETRRKISEAKKGVPSKINGADMPNARKVSQYDKNGNFIKTWDYMKQPSRDLGISYSSICACCNGKQKSAGGFIWRYFSEEVDYAKNISF